MIVMPHHVEDDGDDDGDEYDNDDDGDDDDDDNNADDSRHESRLICLILAAPVLMLEPFFASERTNSALMLPHGLIQPCSVVHRRVIRFQLVMKLVNTIVR